MTAWFLQLLPIRCLTCRLLSTYWYRTLLPKGWHHRLLLYRGKECIDHDTGLLYKLVVLHTFGGWEVI